MDPQQDALHNSPRSQWPNDILAQLLSRLAIDGSMRQFTMLGYLVTKEPEIHLAARKTNAPVVIHINCPQPGNSFAISTLTNDIVSIEVDWGDGCIQHFEKSAFLDDYGSEPVTHVYDRAGDFIVRIFRYGSGTNGTWLDKLCRSAVYLPERHARITKMPSLGNLGITTLSTLFADSKEFNDPSIGDWDTSKITDMSNLFIGAQAFNQPLSRWKVSRVTSMQGMFCGASSFNQPIGQWDVSNVVDMSSMFRQASNFNQPIGSWNVSNVTTMYMMFHLALQFNSPLDTWDVSGVVDMSGMFFGASSFNQPIGSWNVSNVGNMSCMFADASAFNMPLNSWNVSNVRNMSSMFLRSVSFNQPLDGWDVSNVMDMLQMFASATSFQQSLRSWNLTNVINVDGKLKSLRFEYLLRNRRLE